jgi:uncharacterized membrane protein
MLKIPDTLQLNDWEPKKFLRTMVAIQLMMVGSIGLDLMGMDIPILRQVVGFVYLTFVPGIILLRLLKIHRLGSVETVLLSTGLSISFLMFTGFFLNTILSFLRISSPLSFWHVLIFITGLVTLLSILSYKTDKFYLDESSPFKISRSALYLILLPTLSILGTYFINFQNNNIVLMILVILVALIPLLVVLNKIPSELYPLALFVISLSLLFGYSLISMYLTGWDIQQEYYYHKMVVNSGFWNPEIWSNLNAMLSIVILPALYSYFLKMDGAWVFKIVYPIIFSMIPVGLYRIYHRQINSDKTAFLSVFFFMSFETFFTEMLSLARQQIAELFFVLIFFLTVNNTLNKNTRNLLLIIFSASLVTSHYGLSYIYMIFIIFIYLFSIDLVKSSKIQRLKLPEFNLNKSTLYYFVGFYIIFTLLWYMNVSSSSNFNNIVNIGGHISNTIITDFFNPDTRNTDTLMAIGLKDPKFVSLGREVHIALQFITQFFIILGVLKIIIDREFLKIKAEYFYLCIASFGILLLSIILPNFAASLNISRLYHITLFALSPLFVIGGLFVMQKSIKFFKIKNGIEISYMILILGVMIPYFLFNSGIVYEITKDVPNSMFLGMERMRSDNKTKVDFYSMYIPEQDVFSARWYYENKNADERIYADYDSLHYVLVSYGMVLPSTGVQILRNIPRIIPLKYYLYLRKLNVCDDTILVGYRLRVNTSVISPLISNSMKVYSNGCGEIYDK